jgi:signal transduction histidine kinase
VGAVFDAVALAQRAGRQSPAALVVAGLCAVASILVWAITGDFAPSWLKSAGLVTAAAILLTRPVVPDFAPMLLVMLNFEMGSVARPVLGIAVTAAGAAVLIVAGVWTGLVGVAAYIVGVVLGFVAGLVVRWYMRALAAERDNQKVVREQAILAERQGTAREVHDVVAHSLSITLLHLTGARRALQQDRDVDDAVEALVEAERMGRAALADIRRTIGLLTRSSAGTHALPGACDIAELVERSRAARMDVHYDEHGDLAAVSASTGLGLYRIAQESLANIAKHAPRSTAEVRLCVTPDRIRLTVRNCLPSTITHRSASGSGLPGMAARAAQLDAVLSAGPRGGYWEVDVTVPSTPPVSDETSPFRWPAVDLVVIWRGGGTVLDTRHGSVSGVRNSRPRVARGDGTGRNTCGT